MVKAPRITVCAAKSSAGSVRKADARLEVSAAIEAIIESPAGSILVGEVEIAGGHIVIGLLVVGFHPRSEYLVTQPQV